MANHAGSEGVLKVGSDTVAEVRSFSLDTTGDTIEDTAMGDAARTFKAGLTSWSGTAEAFWDEADTAQSALDVGASVTFVVYPEGAGSGDTYFTGTALVTGKTVNSSFDGMVEATFSVTGTGALTETTV
jgi:hypothetical protein